MNRLPMIHELPQDVQDAMQEFIQTGDIPKLDRDLDACIEREYNLINKITSWFKNFRQQLNPNAHSVQQRPCSICNDNPCCCGEPVSVYDY